MLDLRGRRQRGGAAAGRGARHARRDVEHLLLVVDVHVRARAEAGALHGRARKLVVQLLQAPLAEAVERVVLALELRQELVLVLRVLVRRALAVEHLGDRRVDVRRRLLLVGGALCGHGGEVCGWVDGGGMVELELGFGGGGLGI